MKTRNIALSAAVFAVLLVTASSAAAQTPPQTRLVGQVVCSLCWFEAGDRKTAPYGTPADLKCAADCSENGLPQALAVEDEKGFTLYILERGSYKTASKDFLEFVPKTVEIEGDVRTEKDKKFIKVNSLKVVKDAVPKPVAQSDEAVLALKDMGGVDQSLASLRGRVVVLNFWATYCEPCKKEMPDLAAIQNEYAALGLQVIGASTDEAADRPKVLQFIKETKVNFPIWMGAGGADMTRFGLGEALPGTVVIDKSGAIVKVISGVVNAADLRKQIDAMLQVAESSVEKVEPIAKNDVKQKPSKASSVPS